MCNLFLVVIFAANTVLGWHEVGHMTTAAIARYHLGKTEIGKKAMDWSDRILQPLVRFTEENVCPFVEGAVWADRIGAGGWDSMY